MYFRHHPALVASTAILSEHASVVSVALEAAGKLVNARIGKGEAHLEVAIFDYNTVLGTVHGYL